MESLSPAPSEQQPARNIVVKTKDLTKKYGSITAVNELSLELYEGEIFGLLGPNGAGKTTTILMMLGLTEPSAGEIRVTGLDPVRNPLAVKSIVGYLPDNVGFYEDLTGRQNLRYTAELNRMGRAKAEQRIDQLMELVGLSDAADRRVGGYSRGMRQRLGLADVLLKEPRIVILDEPTLGIDPEGVRQLLELITRLSREEGITVLLSSHQLHQVQQICDRVGLFVQGRMIACGPIGTLGETVAGLDAFQIEIGVESVEADLAPTLQTVEDVVSAERLPGEPLWLVRSLSDRRKEILASLLEAGFEVVHLRARGLSLDDIYQRYFRAEEGEHGSSGRSA